MAAWATGMQLGPYVLLARLGAGGMGEVWKARDTRLNRIVAVKRLKTKHTARFEQEARAIAALNHPNICQIFDIGSDYLVLEYIEGSPLAGPVPVAEAVRFATQIAKALDAAHRKRVVHRDLKPTNIMVTAEGTVKLLDFGLAKQIVDSDETQTLEGTVMGTAAYMAPEQAAGKRLDARSDIFSFGAVLYELLSGRRAFSGENAVSTMAAVLHKEPAPLDAPPGLQEVVKRCLMKSPGARFQLAAEVIAALENSAREPGESRPSIAVLPFANMSGDKDNEYFSDGLAEEIINALAQNAGLKVIARTSAFAFRGKEQDIRKIAEALDVKTVLEGSVRRAGNRIRVMAQLINAQDGSHLWSQRYDREMADIFDLQDEIAEAIAGALQVKLSGAPAPLHQYKPSLPAYEAFLRGRYHMARTKMDRAKEAFEQAIKLDPNFSAPYCDRAFCMWASGPRAYERISIVRASVAKALELDPSLPEGHAMLGVITGSFDLDWKEASRQFGLAMAREAIPPFVRMTYAFDYLLPVGRPAEALREVDRALQEDPLNLSSRVTRAACLIAAGRDEEAYEETLRMLEVNPDAPSAYLFMSVNHVLRGEVEKALECAERVYALAPSSSAGLGILAGVLQRTGDAQRACDILQRLPEHAFGGPLARALFYWTCGDLNAENKWLEKAIDQRDYHVPGDLQCVGRELRGTPLWARLMRKLNLLEG